MAMTYMSRKEREEYEERLRKTFLDSADVLPAHVSHYLKRVAKHGSSEVQKQVLLHYRPLIEHLPTDYVDFVIDHFMAKPRRRYDGYSSGYELLNKFGIQNNLECFPPSPVQGPFLHLLSNNEREGLRLVHGLTNAATRAWRAQQQATPYREGVTPLPITINLPDGVREFWGSAQVYSWFRPNGGGPYPVSSALMALELWMTAQLEAGRDAENLFAAVLGGSQSIAAVAVCVSLALAYQAKYLRAALPLVSAPALWDMDVARHTSDSMGSFKSDEFGNNRHFYLIQDELDKRPQRRLDITYLAPHYVFSKDIALRDSFIEAVRGFMNNLPFLTEEAKTSDKAAERLRQRMEEFQFLADPDCYISEQRPDGSVLIYHQQPPHIQERVNKQIAPVLERKRWFDVFSWAWQIINNRRLLPGLTVKDAVLAACSFQRDGDFDSPFEGGKPQEYRRQAIVGVATAVLLVAYEWALEDERKPSVLDGKGALTWCRDVLLAATGLTVRSRIYEDRTRTVIGNPKVMAALGLGAFVTHGDADAEIRRALLELAGDTHLEEVSGVFAGLVGSWLADPVLCWNCLSLALSLSLKPHMPQPNYWDPDWDSEKERKEFIAAENKRRESLLSAHLENVVRSVVPPLPRIPPPAEVNLLWDLTTRVMRDLPLAKLCEDGEAKRQLLQLLDDALTWTITSNSPKDDGDGYTRSAHMYEWNDFIFNWATVLARSLTVEETRRHLLDPVRDCWDRSPALTSALQYHFISNHLAWVEPLADKSQEIWREICGWVLESPEFDSRGRRRSGAGEALALVVFVRYGGSLLTDKWPHASSFTDVIGRWVNEVGGNPYHYNNLLTMLEALRKSFTPTILFEWINRCSESAADPAEFWREHNNGDRTAALLQHIWHGSKETILRDKSTLNVYSLIIDSLVTAGVPLASALQQKLEGRG